METRFIVFSVCLLAGLTDAGYTQILYNEAALPSGIDHTYGNGAPGGGVSFYDFNQDGWDDLTLGSIAGQGIRFYVNTGGQFSLLPPLVEVPFEVKQILWVDYDNDGDPDLYVACFDGHNMLFRNKGGLEFEDVTGAAGMPVEIHRGFGALFADFNRDSWLDLYYVKRRTEDESTLNENRLFLGSPYGTFMEATELAGVADRGKKPFCAVAIDYDNDKWPDIYINNDRQTINTMLRNNRDGTFEDVSASTMTNIQMDAMGTALGDYNNDGWLDMYLSNIPDGNVLLHNLGPDQDGQFTFEDRAATSNTLFNSVGWGTNFLDADNDGDLDLYVSSMIAGETEINSTLYENLGNESFRNLEGQLLGDTCTSFSNAIGDANLDGIADIMVINQGGFRSQLWLSQTSLIPNHFIKIRLEGVVSNRDAIGTRLEAWSGDLYQMRYTHCGIGFLGQNSGTEILGLSHYTTLDSLRATWPTGHVDTWYDLQSDQTFLAREGSSTSDVIHVDPDVTIITSLPPLRPGDPINYLDIYPNPTTIEVFVKIQMAGTYTLYGIDGRYIRSGLYAEGKSIPVADLIPGMYRLVISSSTLQHSGLFYKQ